MNKYQFALNKIIRSCCRYCCDDNGCQNCEIKQTCNATAKSWVDTLQELVDKENRMKEIQKGEDSYCPRCKALMMIKLPSYCWRCGQHLDWSDMFE